MPKTPAEKEESRPEPALIWTPGAKSILSPVGVHRRGRKVLITGLYKTGKSYFAASAPHPICGFDCGDENGLQPYLDESQGDVCIFIESVQNLRDGLEFLFKNESFFKSSVFDPTNLLYSQYQDEKASEFGVHDRDCATHEDDPCDCDPKIHGRWKAVKGEWITMRRRLRRSRFNIIYTCHLKDTLYETTDEGKPGETKKKTTIRSVQLPQIEKNIPYDVDFILQTDVERDRYHKPLPKHTITYIGGRRPKAIPASELHAGKKWTFDAKQEQNPWGKVIAPLDEQWSAGAVDHLGLDPVEAARVASELMLDYQNSEVGRLVALIGRAADMGGLAEVWRREVEPSMRNLGDEQKTLITKAKDDKKAELA